MLANCDNIPLFSPSPSQCPQNQIDDKSLMVSSTTSKLMEKRGQELSQQQPQQALKCPRCDSSNTKFCYYNNYSLSQPRHFCKACKRYWTRGGTLRNVPVGGGCRKNKRVKRPSSSSGESINTTQISNTNPNNPSSQQTQIDTIASSSSNHINHFFYGLSTNPNMSEMNHLQFSARFNSRSVDTLSGYHDLRPQLNALALGFSSGIMNTTNEANIGFNPAKQIQDAVTSNSLLSTYSSIFGSSSTATTSPSLPGLLGSSLAPQNKFSAKDSIREPNCFQSLTPLENMQMSCNGNESGNISMKDSKIEQEESKLGWYMAGQNQIEQMGFSSAEPSFYWNPNTNNVGPWHDPSNIGSSVSSLI